MYSVLLTLHSLFRWVVLVSLLFAIFHSYKGWLTAKPFSKFDDTLRHTTATIVHIQFMIGVGLYLISPIIDYFFDHFQAAVGERQIRFFGMEHSTMMFITVAIISIGSSAAKRKSTDQAKFKTMAIWFTIGLLIILGSIPWPFSPLVSRPYWRTF